MSSDPRGYAEEALSLDGPVCIVEVGKGAEKWTIHEDLLCKSSEYFQGATKAEWISGDRTITMPDDEPEIFQVFAQWLYTSRILVKPRGQKEDGLPYTKERRILVESYLLGEKLQAKGFQDVIIDSLLARIDTPDSNGTRWYPTDLVGRVYDATPPGSPLRLLVVDMIVYCGEEGWILNTHENVEFLRDLAKGLLRHRSQPQTSPLKWFGTKGRYYHENGGTTKS